MDVFECLAAYVSTPSTRLVVSTQTAKEATVYGLHDARLSKSLTSITLGEIVEWLITGGITSNQLGTL